MIQNIHTILKKLYMTYAVVFPPVKSTDAGSVSLALVRAGAPKIPMDYALFLEVSNGLYWNGLELFALTEQPRGKGAFMHAGIAQSYLTYLRNPMLNKKLVVGTAPESLIAYDARANAYQMLDRTTYGVVAAYPAVADVLQAYADFKG
ncbi:MAG: hypothetical protein PHX68_04880 [Alphaproteobacteria bacterium]|nr:hypothetical protein [Alphaproteobacteria bacterium]